MAEWKKLDWALEQAERMVQQERRCRGLGPHGEGTEIGLRVPDQIWETGSM